MNDLLKFSVEDKFLKQDIFDLKDYPNENFKVKIAKRKKTIVDISNIKSNKLKVELKEYIKYIANREDLKSNSLKIDYITPIQILIKFLENLDVESITNTNNNFIDDYKRFLIENNISAESVRGDTPNTLILRKFKEYIIAEYDTRIGFDRDIWKLKDFNISFERINKSSFRDKFDFTDIENFKNRELTKLYFKYLIGNTDLSIATITSRMYRIKSFLAHIGNTDLNSINRKNVEMYYEEMNKKNLKDRTFNQCVIDNLNFLQYLELKGLISRNYFFFQDTKYAPIEFKLRSVDPYVIKQIFNILDKIPSKLSIMYLTLYCVGMRVSELCQMKTDCLYRTENGYFIKYYSQKMKKEVTNPIPENLYKLLLKQIEMTKSKFSNDEKYLFASRPNKAFLSTTFREQMKKELDKFNIRNSDGTKYNFKSHDYRHTLATNMLEQDIPLSIIQKILHHDSIEMSLAYVEVTDKRKIEKHKEFINVKGKISPIFTDIKLDDVVNVEWIKENINAQMLPNGICGLPAKLKKCPHANSCLTCKNFRTSIQYLDIHKQQLTRTEEYIKIAKLNNWIRQVETNEEVRDNLIKIISVLEGRG